MLEIGPVFGKIIFTLSMFDVPETPFWLTGIFLQTHDLEYNDALIAMQKRSMQPSTLYLGAQKASLKRAPHGNCEVAATDPAGDAFFGESQTNSWKRLPQRWVKGHSGAVCTAEEDISC